MGEKYMLIYSCLYNESSAHACLIPKGTFMGTVLDRCDAAWRNQTQFGQIVWSDNGNHFRDMPGLCQRDY